MKPFYFRAMSPTYVLLLPAGTPAAEEEWPVYGHDLGGARYSPLSQITPGNVHPPETGMGIPHRGFHGRFRR